MNYRLAAKGAKWLITEMKRIYSMLFPDNVSVMASNIVITDVKLAEKFAQFEEILTKELEHNLNTYHYVSLGCCYRPDRTLAMLAKKANISTAYFPEHAHLEIINNTVWVSFGRQEPYKLHISN